MDTLIKGLETPKSCYSETYSEQGNCWFFFYDFKGGCHCSISDCKCLKTKRPKGCPLVEVPQHGDLIERKYVYDASKDKKYPLLGQACILSVAENAPVILESSK